MRWTTDKLRAGRVMIGFPLRIEDVIFDASERDELQNDPQNMRYEFLRHVDFDEYLQKNAHGVA